MEGSAQAGYAQVIKYVRGTPGSILVIGAVYQIFGSLEEYQKSKRS